MTGLEKGNWILLVVFLTIVFIMSLWTIDISVSAAKAGAKLGNGFWIRNPSRAYHVGMWLGIASWFSLVIVSTKFILGE